MEQIKHNKKIAIDLDGVIWDLVRPWITYYNLLYEDNISYNEIIEYDLSKSLTKASYDDIKNILQKKTFWDNVFPFENAVEYLYRINKEFDLYIATATSYEIATVKIKRFLKLFPFISSNQIICIHNKSLLNVDWLVDDCENNLLEGKFNKIILDAPYNKKMKCKYRAKDLKEVYNIIKNN